MKSKLNEDSQRILLLLKLDAKRLFEKVKYRAPEYLYEFSLKRSREHFVTIFANRYESVGIKELMLCSEDVIVGLDQFYTKIDEMRWYLNVTQDMPNKVEDKVHSHVRELDKLFNTLTLYIDAELGIKTDAVIEAE